MDKIYWDNSNILISAQDVAEEQEGWGARSRVRIHFSAMIGLVRRQKPSDGPWQWGGQSR